MYLILVISLVGTLASPSRSSHSEITFSHQFEKELNLLKEKVENLEGGKNELSSLKIQVESLEKGESILKMKVESLEKSETDLKKKVEHLEKGKTELIMKIEKLEKGENDLKKKIEDMETSESFSKPKIENYEERKREESKKNNAFSETEVMKSDKTEPVNTQDKIDTKEDQNYTAEEIDAGLTHRAGNNTEDRLAYLEELSKLNLRRSCHELAKYGVNINSYYYVDPDGILVGAAPIGVWCEFSNGFAVTEVYSAPDFQIQSLIKISEKCKHIQEALRCWGEAQFDAGTSCAAIKRAGEFRRGYFNVKATEEENSKLVFCEASPGYEENSEDEVFIESSEDHFQSVESTISGIKVEITEMATELTDVGGQVSILQDNVENLMVRSDYCGYQSNSTVSSGKAVTYEKLLVENNHNAPGSTLNIHTGEFKAGMSGLYKVDVSMRMVDVGNPDCEVYIARNGAWISESHMLSNSHSDGYDMGGRSMMVELNSGDTLSIRHADSWDYTYDLIFCVSLAK